MAQRAVGLFRLVHPFPSLLNSGLVAAIVLVAGGSGAQAVVLGLSMLGLQFCIGAVNDVFDQALDAESKPAKPIPAGLVSPHVAKAVAMAAGGIGVALAIGARLDIAVPLMALWMLGAGLVYDAWLKPTRFGWMCFAAAFPVLPVFAWYGATGMMPPRWEVLLPVAALAGPALQLANGLVDLETDAAAGLRTLPVLLGRRTTLVAMASLMAVIHALAWLTLPAASEALPRLVTGAATVIAAIGVALSFRASRQMRDLGWSVQAASIAVLGAGWLLSLSLPR
ncbi:MAG: UbiA family prenyltransferase [Candidatus Limnocylindrales bacterium]